MSLSFNLSSTQVHPISRVLDQAESRPPWNLQLAAGHGLEITTKQGVRGPTDDRTSLDLSIYILCTFFKLIFNHLKHTNSRVTNKRELTDNDAKLGSYSSDYRHYE